MYQKSQFMNLTMMHFECFIQVAELGTTLRAAEVLNLSQPVVSQKIAQLERAVKLELFTRTKRRLVLTDAGQEFLSECKETLSKWGSFLDRMIAQYSDIAAKPLRIGFSEGEEPSEIWAVIRALARQFPGVDVSPVIENRDVIAKKLLSGEVEIALIMDTENLSANKNVRYRTIGVLPLNCMVHRDSQLAQKGSLTDKDLVSCKCYWPTALKNSKNLKDQQRYFRERGIFVEWVYRDVDFSTIRSYLQDENSFTLTWNRKVDDRNLKLYQLDGISCPVIAAWKKTESEYLEPYVEKLIAITQKLNEKSF